MLHGYERITLRAFRGRDWKQMIRKILENNGWDEWDDEWPKLNLDEWDRVREDITGSQDCDWIVG